MSYFAEPANKSLTNSVTLTNISTNDITHGFDIGWNCFMVELAYDDNSINETLDLKAYTINQTNYTFNGSYNSTSEGTIVSSTNKMSDLLSPIPGGISNAFGSTAKEWIINNSNASSGPILKNLSNSFLANLTSNPLSAIISNGLNQVFGSIFGKDQSVTQSIQFNTDGEVSITGSGLTAFSGIIAPLQGIPLGGTGHNLGAWNLVSEPTFTLTTIPELINIRDNGPYLLSWYKVTGVPSLTVVRNPTAGTSCSVTHSLTRYDKYNGDSNYDFNNLDSGKTRVEMVNSSSIGYTQNTLYDNGNTVITSMPSTYVFITYDNYPRWKSSDDKPVDYLSNTNKDMHQLNYVILSNNKFSGTFPTEILRDNLLMDFDNNDIEALPFEIWNDSMSCAIPILTNNKLNGPVPEWVQQTERWQHHARALVCPQKEGYGYDYFRRK